MVETFGSWLRIQIGRRFPSQAEFARQVGVLPQVVSNWVGDKNKPELESIGNIARVLGMSAHEVAERAEIDLPGMRPAPRSAEDILAELEANQPVAVPIVQNVVAYMGGTGGTVLEYLYLPPAYRKGKKKNILGLIADGTCMSPLIEPGDYVICDQDASWAKGDIVVAVVDGTTYVKRVAQVGKRTVIRGDADGCTLTLGEDDRIVGRVLMFTRPLIPMR